MPFTDDPAPLIRLTSANYSDGAHTPAGGTDPVSISAGLFDQDGAIDNTAGLSNLFVAWGQFLDHDLSLSPEGEDETISAEGLMAPLHRSQYTIDDSGARVPVNAITWAIDGSQIYGSSTDRTDALRSFENGHLRMGEDASSNMGLMPEADHDTFMAGTGEPGNPMFLAGDIRANENPALASLHTLMARDHNYWADRLADEHPDWSDEQLFQGARQIVEYELQKVTYEEWLPYLVGDAVGPDTGYDPDAEGQISVEFSTAAFRFGHTMVSSTLPQLNADGTQAAEDLNLMEAFFNSAPLRDGGIDAILRGQAASTAQELDTQVVDDLNLFLFTPDGINGFSLVALNLLRGQDHGLQSYIDTRAALIGDIDPATIDPGNFGIITSDPVLQAELAGTYDSVHDVELWVGGLAEDKIGATQMGHTFTAIIADQFGRTRAADESFGELDPSLGADIIAEVENTSLSDIILRNTEIDMIQDDPFVATPLGLTEMIAPDCTPDDDFHDLAAKDVSGELATGRGDDTVLLRGGSNLNDGANLGSGDDLLLASSGKVSGTTRMGEGNDKIVLSGDASATVIKTGNGKDDVCVTGNAVVDMIATGNGSDRVEVDARATVNSLQTGNGPDQIVLEHGADVSNIDGGRGPDQISVTGGRFRVDWENGDPRTNAGTIVYLDNDGTETGITTEFQNVETVTCFTPGTRIITANGAIAIEKLKAGDAVYTLDNGLQPLRWIGRTTVLAEGRHAPIRIARGALGNSRDMEVSPQHRMLLSDWRCELVCGTDEVLAPALHLLNDGSIQRRRGGTVDYIHLLFDTHQIVIADGIPSESFHPGAIGLGAMSEEARQEIRDLFPQLSDNLDAFGPAARHTAKPYEAQVIVKLG